MTWQTLLFVYFILATTSYLLRRKLGTVAPKYNRFVNWFFFGLHYPIGVIVAIALHQSLHISLQDLVIIAAAGLVFPFINIAQYRASKDVDAGLFTLLNNFTPIITITTAWILLHEGLTSKQFIGAVIIIAATFLVSLPGFLSRSKSRASGLLFAFLSILMLGVATTFERLMLTRISFSAYLLYAWGFQTFWMTIIAWPQRKHIKILTKAKLRRPIIAFGIVNTAKGLCWLGALRLSGNASLVSAFGSFTAVLVILAAYFILRERDHLALKLAAALVGAAGLTLLYS